jgi:aspartyl-tRNA(Asn)/glutamyl-tRNA(Gln) amidotransferase subunit B
MNSFRSVERAVAYEIERQAAIIDRGETLVMETRGWSDERGETYRMRAKETSDDYRYFPEPDLPPLRVDDAWLREIAAALPELPAARRARYRDAHGLTPYDAAVLVSDADAAALFEATLAADGSLAAKPVANWVTGEYLRIRNAAAEPIVLQPGELAILVRLVSDGSISRGTGKDVLQAHLDTGEPVEAIVEARGLRQISDSGALGSIVDEVLAANPDAVADVRAGKDQAIGFLVGQVMKATRGQANAAVAQAALRERLEQPEERT